MENNEFVINSINSNNEDNYELRAKDSSLSFSFKYIVEVSASRDEQLLGFYTDSAGMISVERRLIDETDAMIQELII